MTARLIVLCVILGISSAVFSLFFVDRSTGDPSIDFSALPMNFQGWQGEELEVEDRVFEILETKNVALRRYVDRDNVPVHFSLVYAQDNRSAFHPPEICYTGSDYEILDKSQHAVYLEGPAKTVTVNRLLLERDGARLVTYYWFMLGDQATSNYYRQQAALVRNELASNHAIGALLQVSVPVTGESGEGVADVKIARFINDSFSYIAAMLES